MISELDQKFSLPPDLASVSTAQFDRLLASDFIKYAPSTPELVRFPNGHSVQFRLVPSLSRKPMPIPSAASHTDPHPAPALPDQTPQTKPKPPFNPFLKPKPEEIVLPNVGPHHRLLLNKYCVTRPMLLLTTVEFRSQSDDLDKADLDACWAVLRNVGPEWMVIYNCGPESGNSQRHKHLQCFPKFEGIEFPPDRRSGKHGEYDVHIFVDFSPSFHRVWRLMPEAAVAENVYAVDSLPYHHFIAYLPEDVDAQGLLERYQQLLGLTKAASPDSEPSYNLILVHNWMMLAPRSHSFREGIGTNATGMVGMIWLAREEERNMWEQLGVMDTLGFLGVKRDENTPGF